MGIDTTTLRIIDAIFHNTAVDVYLSGVVYPESPTTTTGFSVGVGTFNTPVIISSAIRNGITSSLVNLTLTSPLTFDQTVYVNVSTNNVIRQDNASVGLAQTSYFRALNNKRDIIEDFVTLTFYEGISTSLLTTTINNLYVKVNGVPRIFNPSDVHLNTTGLGAGISTNLISIILPTSVTYKDIVTMAYVPGNIINASGLGMTTFDNVYVNNKTATYHPLLFDVFDWLDRPFVESFNFNMNVGLSSDSFTTDESIRVNSNDIIIPTNHLDQRRIISESQRGIGSFAVTHIFDSSFSDTFTIYRDIKPATADLYERRTGYPFAAVDFDVHSPVGDIVINDNSMAGGIQIHHLRFYDGTGATISPDIMALQDPLGTNKQLITSNNFGNEIDESNFVHLGFTNNRSLISYFDVSGVTIKGVEIGANALKPKSYVLEVNTGSGDDWIPVLYMFADSRTRDFFKFEFDSAVIIQKARIKYKGDYFSSNTTGDITVSAFDEMGNVTAISIAHDRNFIDATDSTFLTGLNSPGIGWAPFSEGTAKFNWDLININRLWSAQNGQAIDALQFIFVFNNLLIVLSKTTANVFDSTNTIVQQQIFSTTINTYAIHNNKLYLGMANGSIYVSANGQIYTLLPSIIPEVPAKPITAMTSFGGFLYIGVDYTNASLKFANLWKYSDTSITFTTVRSFPEPIISKLVNIKGSLYAGLLGAVDSTGAFIYRFDGRTWTLSSSTADDGINDIIYSPITDTIWVGYTGGRVNQATFDSSNNPIWGNFSTFNSDSNTYSSIYGGITTASPVNIGDRINEFVWLCADTELVAYAESTTLTGVTSTFVEKTFSLVNWPNDFNNGLKAIWRQGSLIPGNSYYSNVNGTGSSNEFTSPIIATIPAYVTNGPINFDFGNNPSLLPVGVGTTTVNVTWTGFIKANNTDTYTFYFPSSGGSRMYIDNAFVVGDFTDHVFPTTDIDTPIGNFNMLAGHWYPVKLQYFIGIGSTGSGQIALSWSSPTISKEIIPATSMVDQLTKINAMYTINNITWGVAENGKIYTVDTATISSQFKNIFMRLRDEFGNETPGISTIGATPNSYDYLGNGNYIFDFIAQESIRNASGGRTSSGKITQVKQNKTIAYTFTPEAAGALYAPDRIIRQFGFYLSEPFYVATLTQWGSITFLIDLPSTGTATDGLDSGVSVDIYIKTANTKSDVINKDWDIPFSRTTIDGSSASQNNLLVSFNIQAFTGKWLMYRLVLTTASRGVSPVVHSVTLSYSAANASYFFSTLFNAEHEKMGYYNYIRNPDFEFDTGTIPTDWTTVGNNISIVITSNINEAITGQSMKIGVGTTSGDYVSTGFFINDDYDGKSLIVQYDYKSIVGFSTNALQVVLRDITTGINTTVTPSFSPSGQGTFNAAFTLNNIGSGATCELRFVAIGNTSFTYVVDNIYVGPSYINITDTPTFRRGLLTANYALNNGQLTFGYTTDDRIGNTFDFSTFTEIIPNTLFSIPTPDSKIRFGMALVSIGTTPVIVDEYAVQLDISKEDFRFMALPQPNV